MYKNFDLSGKVAVVTGGAGDLGSAIAVGLAQAGADIAIADLKLDSYPEVEKKIKAEGKQCMSSVVDVTNEKSVADMVAAVMQKYAKIDILVCAHGIAIRKPADTFPVEEWQKVMDVNSRGVFICCQAVGRIMLKQQSGRIINLSSVRGEYGLPANYVAYSPSKAAVNLITKDLACEWAKKGITVNAIAPTVIESALTKAALAVPGWGETMKARIPMGRFGVTEDLVGPVIFFASKASDFVTGQILYIDGGVTTC
jgi:NAD(P)-dependent dehydrogenase (short-subunit alcohol dehydrogenase family)